ncbi:hypothetical protein [Desertivirga xinjiangensis]|uniref:hypothetical protein n=1 Tax=Desertivirga xinjiangensis TaxID=539206 RepID=UPI00210D1F56|nr:hypothetical protein [Pedobacter xinjiangensis]
MSENTDNVKGKAVEAIVETVLAGEAREIIWRTGDASEVKEPKIVVIAGVLDSPYNWLLKRYDSVNVAIKHEQKGLVPVEHSHLLVDRDKLRIDLVIGEQNHYGTKISGSLELHPTFLKFGVNSGKYLTPFQMADLIKMNRTFFESHQVAGDLVTALKNFTAKVDKAVELSDNNRGNKRVLVDQVAKTNVPEKFNLKLPIFKGQPVELFEVEVYFNSDDLTCTLISPSANDITESLRDTAIDAELSKVRSLVPDLVIIEK